MFESNYHHDGTNKKVTVYDVTYDRFGFPTFLIYDEKQWVRRSAKYFSPIGIPQDDKATNNDSKHVSKIGFGLENCEYYFVDAKDIVKLTVLDVNSSHEPQPIIGEFQIRLKKKTKLSSNECHLTLQELIDRQDIAQIHIYMDGESSPKFKYFVCWDGRFMTRNNYQKAFVTKNGDVVIDIRSQKHRKH